MITDTGAVLVRPSPRSLLGHALLLATLAAVYAGLWWAGSSSWIDVGRPVLVAGVVMFGVVAVAGLAGALATVRVGWLVRLDDTGITLRGGPTVAWGELTSVRRTSLLPGVAWRPHLDEVVAFVPRADAELPGFPGRLRRFTAGLNRRRFGTPLVLLLAGTDTRWTDVVAAADRFAGLPSSG